MARPYTLVMPGYDISGSVANPFFQLAAPTGVPLELVGFHLGQGASETSEQVAVSLSYRSTASQLATGITAGQVHRGDVATSMASSTTTNCYGAWTASGTLTKLGPIIPGNLLGPGLLWFPPSDMRPIITPGAFLTMEALAAFATATHYLTVYVNEMN